jgi:hypothetical protein
VAISRTQMGSQLRGNRVKKSKSGKLSDLTGDGKVTQADVLKGRGVFKKGGNVKKYQAGGKASKKPMRPRARPDNLMEGRRSAGMKSSIRPIARPKEIEDMMSTDNPVGRGNRASMREAMEMPEGMKMGGKVGMHKMPDGTMMKDSAHKMKEGGKVRGYGKARGGKACKMM